MFVIKTANEIIEVPFREYSESERLEVYNKLSQAIDELENAILVATNAISDRSWEAIVTRLLSLVDERATLLPLSDRDYAESFARDVLNLTDFTIEEIQ